MKKTFTLAAVALALSLASPLNAQTDFERDDLANLKRYSSDNTSLIEKMSFHKAKRPKAVLLGDSITDGWASTHPEFFTKNNFVGRGISGQTTARILLRFQRDVVDLHPKRVVIMTGINDIAQNGGWATPENVIGYIESMCQMAKVNRIKPYVCTLPPADHFQWKEDSGVKIPEVNRKVRELNNSIRSWAGEHGIPVVDYEAILKDSRGITRGDYSSDSVHPNEKAYTEMEKLLLNVL